MKQRICFAITTLEHKILEILCNHYNLKKSEMCKKAIASLLTTSLKVPIFSELDFKTITLFLDETDFSNLKSCVRLKRGKSNSEVLRKSLFLLFYELYPSIKTEVLELQEKREKIIIEIFQIP